jgi:hypothetical protein
LTQGTGGSVITEAKSKAQVISTQANRVVNVYVPMLQKGTDIAGQVRIGTSRNELPSLEVGANGVLTMAALTFSNTRTNTVKLSFETS